MSKDVLSNFDMPWVPITGLLIFMVCFVAYIYWTYKKENKDVYDRASMLPLSEEAMEKK
jgi:cbb3-type cytochrome oxidase subunit 3